MTQDNLQVCPACEVKILSVPRGEDKVLFSAGPASTRAMLWARVCQYAQKPGCINKNKDAIGEVKPSDYYESEI